MRVVAGSDWVIDVGPGAGEDGGRVIAEGPPEEVAQSSQSRTAPYLARAFADRQEGAKIGPENPQFGPQRGFGGTSLLVH